MEFVSQGDLCVDIYEVTNAKYTICVAEEACTEPEYTRSLTRDDYFGSAEFDDYPVIHVSWGQAEKYCAFANKRLLKASEWEVVVGNLEQLRLENITEPRDTQLVGSEPLDISSDGIYDLAGNVREWIDDSDGIKKLVKGYSFNSYEGEFVSLLPAYSDLAVGFRCATNTP